MGIIKVLDKKVYNKIAAGEVVEKPASIVKELVENSIDAGATEITIKIENGGIRKIVVQDNGCGIDKDDILNAFLPHATSKIETAQDLYNLNTLGFRGEALASISAVSQVTMTTKTENCPTGYRVEINGGDFSEITEVATIRGTSICVENLFFNIPARAKFLRKPKLEENDITNYVQKLILANSTINFKYIIDEKIVYNTTNCGLKDIIYTIYGKDIASNLLEVKYKDNDYSISGYIVKPEFAKSNRTFQNLFVNNRYVNNYMVSSAVQNAFEYFIMKGKFAVYILFLNVSPQNIDVNVHPSKLEIKFENSQHIYGIFNSAVYTSLLNDSHVIKNYDFGQQVNINNKAENRIATAVKQEDTIIKPDRLFSFEKEKEFKLESSVLSADINNEVILENHFEKKNIIEPIVEVKPVVQMTMETELTNCKIVGTMFETYIIVENADNIFVIDQHAAHERLKYDKLLDEIKSNSLAVQNLLVPYIFDVSIKENSFIHSNINLFKEFGIEMEEFGLNTFKVTAVPYILSEINLKNYFNDILENSEQIAKKPVQYIKEYFTQRACKSAVKAGNKLSEMEINTLLDNFKKNNNELKCPHGRPLIINITKQNIEKMFKRIV